MQAGRYPGVLVRVVRTRDLRGLPAQGMYARMAQRLCAAPRGREWLWSNDSCQRTVRIGDYWMTTAYSTDDFSPGCKPRV